MSIVPGRDVPEVPQAWVDAVNTVINDANHDDLCACDAWPDGCKYYKPGQWDIGVDLDIAVGVLDPLIRRRIGGEFTEAAEVLGSAVRGLDAHIERRAQEIAQPQIDAARADAERQIKELRHDLAFSEQRREDVIAEVQRQHKARDRHAGQQATRIADLAATIGRVREIRCWQNEDGRWFAFREDLYAALNGEAPATETKANQEAGS